MGGGGEGDIVRRWGEGVRGGMGSEGGRQDRPAGLSRNNQRRVEREQQNPPHSYATLLFLPR